MPATFTHTGRRPHVGYDPCGAVLWGHHMPKPGKRHALTGGPKRFTALCGETVDLVATNEFGEDVAPNVHPAGELPVTCKRCLRAIKE